MSWRTRAARRKKRACGAATVGLNPGLAREYAASQRGGPGRPGHWTRHVAENRCRYSGDASWLAKVRSAGATWREGSSYHHLCNNGSQPECRAPSLTCPLQSYVVGSRLRSRTGLAAYDLSSRSASVNLLVWG